MQVNGPNHLDALRLVHPPQRPAAATSVDKPAEPAQVNRPSQSNPFAFESAYIEQLPRMEYTDAHRRVERIRDTLVGGSTPVPIHFESSPQALHQPAANPYANPYMKLAPAPGEANLRATQREAGDA